MADILQRPNAITRNAACAQGPKVYVLRMFSSVLRTCFRNFLQLFQLLFERWIYDLDAYIAFNGVY